MSDYLSKAKQDEAPIIWAILQDAIQQRKKDGSRQWQDGYPNLKVVEEDISKGVGFVFRTNNKIIGCCSLFINEEPLYSEIDGKWLTNSDFIAFHRLAIKSSHIGKGWATKILECIESYALKNNIYSIKADTNFDNLAMLKLFKKMKYTYCGEINVRQRPRKAFEKVLSKTKV